MTTFREQLAADLKRVIFNPDEFAVQVVYTPKGGAAKPGVPMLIDYGSGDGGDGADELHTNATGRVMASDIPLAQEGDAVSIGAETWIVDFGRLIGDGLLWQVWISRVTR